MRAQVCGARGGGDAAAQGLFLAFGPQLVFMLVRLASRHNGAPVAGCFRIRVSSRVVFRVVAQACESARQRNAAILLIRHYAKERGVVVLGPKDKV